ncbi:DUF5916 domain-containing protein [Candidatus Latescibacterota bacterium]
MTNPAFHKQNQQTVSSLCIDMYPVTKSFLKILFLMTTFFLMTAAQDVLPQESIVAKAGDIPYRVPLVDTPVKVDAVLDEDVWKKAVHVDANIEVWPGNNIPSPVKTEALIAYDMENIYVAIIADDPDPSKIRARISDRDNLSSDDWVVFLIDTFNEQKRSYDFFCNPLGIQADQIETTNGGGEYDAIWDSAGRITDKGYIVEMTIPFSSIQFQNTDGDQIWSFDIVRSYPRTVRHHIGAFPRDRNNNCYLCQAPRLIGFAGVKPGKSLELDPTFSARLTQERRDVTSGSFKEKDRALDPGVTARWSVTPNMMLSTTLNPDFSQVEADAAQMDINTKFPLYYSEKRPFFVEGSEIFRGGFNLVHTRTLAEPDWGMKLTGKEGKHTIGFFTARDRVTPLVFPGAEGGDNTTLSLQSTGTVLRYKHDVGESSYIGTTVTDREGDEYHNRVASIDAELKFTPKDNLRFQAVGTNTAYSQDVTDEFDQPDGEFGGSAFGVNYNHSTKEYFVFAEYDKVDSDFRTDMGFMTQAGYDEIEIGGQYRWEQGPDHWYTRIGIFAKHGLRRDSAGNMLKKEYVTSINYNGPLQSYIELYGNFGESRYDGNEYRADNFGFYGGLMPTGSTNFNLQMNAGDQIDYDNSRQGKNFTFSPRIEQKIGRYFTVSVDHRYQQMNVESKRLYDANVSNARFTYNFSRRAFIRVNLQNVDYSRNLGYYLEENREDFDANTRKVFSQILFSYKINPQTVFFLGYSDNYRNRDYTDDRGRYDNDLTQTNRTIFTKIGYAWML